MLILPSSKSRRFELIGLGIILFAVLDVTAKVIFGLILTSASSTTLAKATNSDRMMNAAELYIEGYRG